MKGRLSAGLLLAAALMSGLVFSGCGEDLNLPSLMQTTPTPEPALEDSGQVVAEPQLTATPTPAPTVEPTKAPRMIGRKSTSAGSVRISNSSGLRFRSVFLQVSGMEEWGRNLIPAEGSIHVSEQFMLYYPDAVAGNTYNLRLRDEYGEIYEIYSVDLNDMETAVLRKDDEGTVYLSYMSLSAGSEKDTRGSSWGLDGADENWRESSYTENAESAEDVQSAEQDVESADYSDWDVEEYVYEGGDDNDGDSYWETDYGYDLYDDDYDDGLYDTEDWDYESE